VTWESFVRVEVNEELNGYIDRVVDRYPLRGFDAIHLASALTIREIVPENFLMRLPVGGHIAPDEQHA
jgi:hypothetical protein